MNKANQRPAATGDGETVLREARASWWGLWPPMAFGVIAGLIGLWMLLNHQNDYLGLGVAGAGAVAFIWYFGGALTKRMSMLVKLTDRCIVLETGIASFHTSTVMLNRIESMDVDQTVWQRMMDYGTLTVRGMGSEDLRMVGIHDPVGFQAEARRYINLAGNSTRV